MNKLLLNTSSIILTLVFTTACFASEKPMQMKPHKSSAALEQIKALAGTWKGTANSNKQAKNKKPQSVTVSYKVTSGGSAVVETTFPGTPQEMVTVYRDVNGKLNMTHYCMLGNQPRLTLSKATEKRISMSFNGGQNFNPKKDPHMHSLTLDIKNKNRIVQNWSFYSGGKQQAINSISLSRVK